MQINKVLFQKMQNAFLISISVLCRSKRKQAIIAAGNNYQLSANYFQVWDEVVLSKTVLSNFRPKQVDEWIRGPRASLFQLFIAFLT